MASETGMWQVSAEQAAQAAVVLVVFPDGVFTYTHQIPESEVAPVLRRVADHIDAGAVVEAEREKSKKGGA